MIRCVEVYPYIDVELRSPHVREILPELVPAVVNVPSSAQRVTYAPAEARVIFRRDPLDDVAESFSRVQPFQLRAEQLRRIPVSEPQDAVPSGMYGALALYRVDRDGARLRQGREVSVRRRR